jgi:hypothetical protein
MTWGLSMWGRSVLARIHQTEGRPTLEGILVARRPEYRLAAPKLIDGEDRAVPLDGDVEVLREHVLFVQLLAKAA